jgi:16S rRNA (cytidine1402-2'-O)-methyltransferase
VWAIGSSCVASVGTLYVVGTPIGNLGDLSPRARAVLEDAELVVAEDTRRVARLAHLAGLQLARVRALQGAGRLRDDEFIAACQGGAVALVSDAGMPGVSDPGGRLVGVAYAHGIEVRVVPGPSVLGAVLSLWPEELDGACFMGFLPRRGRLREEALAHIVESRWPTVVLESPLRVGATLAELAARVPSRRVLVASELTKLHEQVRVATLAEAARELLGARLRGEWALVVGGRGAEALPGNAFELDETLRAVAATSLPIKEGASLVARLFGLPTRDAYDALLAVRGGRSLDSSVPQERRRERD